MCDLQSISFSDHRGCSLLLKFVDVELGKGYWKFNSSLLQGINYVNFSSRLFDDFQTHPDDDDQTTWELLEIKV